jgi:hypothetical protein
MEQMECNYGLYNEYEMELIENELLVLNVNGLFAMPKSFIKRNDFRLIYFHTALLQVRLPFYS